MAKRIEVVRNPQVTYALLGGETKPKYTKTIATKPGDVTLIDKAKGYYHSVITFVGLLLVFANEATPLFAFLAPEYRHWVDLVIVLITFIANVLKQNEQWVNDL